LLALSAFVGTQSRGLPVTPPEDARLRPFLEAGRQLYELRQGQLNLSCGQCHDDNWGKRLAGAAIPQAHPNGYPIYRLEWQGMGSLQRRLRNCLIGMRAEHFEYGAPEYVDLELYLAWRGRGLPVETPAVRP
jgi:sulfur-oxidizing protein SoxA